MVAAKSDNFSIHSTVKDRVPALPFSDMKEKVLGKNYELSLVIAGDQRTQRLNAHYRNKTYIPNVLTFPLDHTHGEIFLNPKQIARETRKNGETIQHRTALCFIHGLLHLKGLAHGSTMDTQEARLLAQFGFSD